ncbi:MAG: energy transducer TonB [Helicobacteraceae bacterium]|jgi:protein TonB|nr:energy transducer TonB [Helicobacteraceae bacterium]
MYLLLRAVNNPLLKLSAAIALGVAVSLIVFWFMAIATSFAPSKRDYSEFDRIVDFVRVREESKIVERQRPVPPPKQIPPEPMELDVGAIDEQNLRPFEIDTSALSLTGAPVLTSGLVAERGLIPISGLSPQYPRAAKMRGIEGEVELEFIIDESGKVRDVKVIAATNGDYFVDVAIRAVTRWRFAPKIVNGKAARQLARQNFTFRLDR